MTKYFVIYNSDGETSVRKYSEEELLKRIDDGDLKGFVSAIPDPDTNYWGDSVLIIKGEIISPKPIEVVTKYQL